MQPQRINMATSSQATSNHIFGTKRKCGICLCICIFSDIIILAIYWNKIGDAIRNPFIAIINSLEQKNSNEAQQWGDDKPDVGRIIYHFGGTLLYVGYTSMNIILLMNNIVGLYYLNRTSSWNPNHNRFLRPFIFKLKGRFGKAYFMMVIVLHLIICMDDVLISHTIGYKLPFNELCMEILRQLTMLAYKAMSHVINSLFFVFFLLISSIIIMSIKMTIILTCLDNFYGDGIKHYQTPTSSRPTTSDTTRTAALNPGTSEEGMVSSTETRTTATTQHIFIMPTGKNDDLPPSYEEEILPPTYEEAIILASKQTTKIHSG